MELSDCVLSLVRLDVQWKCIVQMLIDGSLSELGGSLSLLLRCFTFLEETKHKGRVKLGVDCAVLYLKICRCHTGRGLFDCDRK